MQKNLKQKISSHCPFKKGPRKASMSLLLQESYTLNKSITLKLKKKSFNAPIVAGILHAEQEHHAEAEEELAVVCGEQHSRLQRVLCFQKIRWELFIELTTSGTVRNTLFT
jgi:hypothetical protein